MSPVILLIGKVGSGKSTYAATLAGTVRLSVDDWTLRLFPEGCGAEHDRYARRIREGLYSLAREISAAGVPVVLDWGFWSRALRREAVEALAGCPLEWRWICPSQDEHRRRIDQRNREVEAGLTEAYRVDEGLAAKCEALFEIPDTAELPGLRILTENELGDGCHE